MIGNRKAVRLLVDAGNQFGDMAVWAERDELVLDFIGGLARDDNFNGGVTGMVAGFITADDRDVLCGEEVVDCGKLRDAAVEDDEVRVRPLVVLEAASQDLAQTFKIIVLLLF